MGFGPVGEPRVIDVLYWLGSLPALIAVIVVFAWALRSSYDQPRCGWLMLAVSGLNLFAMFGLRAIVQSLVQIGPLLGVPVDATFINGISFGASLLLSIAVWTLALMAVFGADERGMPAADSPESGR